MFQDSNYNILEFLPPANGMNRNISKDVLPINFAYVFENVLSVPLGETQVRYGTKKVIDLPFENIDYNILEAFPFQKTNGDKQIVAYLSYFKLYVGAANINVIDQDQFSFTPNNQIDFFEEDTPIKIEYNSDQGVVTTSSIIKTVNFENNGDIRIVLKSSVLKENANISSFYFSKGKIVIYDFATNSLVPNVGVDNLHAGVVPRSVTYLAHLLICNGIDRNYSWDGITFKEVFDFVKEQATNFNRIDATHFSFLSNNSFDITKYQNNAIIQLIVDGAISTLSVANVAVNGNTINVTTAENLPAFTGQNRIELFYKDYPPSFSFMHVAHDRIWGLPPGAVSLNYRNPKDALRVYYSYRVNTLTNWFNENTKTVPSIDISAKHEVPDNLEAIISVNGFMAFMGRKKTQVWSGQDPSNVQSPVAFNFSSLLSIGIVHGNLFVELPNDTYFVSQNGILSFGTLNVARQFAATSVDAVDPLVRKYVVSTTEHNEAYRACRAFKYNSGSFCGFKIGFNSSLIGIYSSNIYSWSLFSGDFKFSSTFLTTLDNALYLFIDDIIYQYADGVGTSPVYGDTDGESFINFIWSFPTTQLKGRRFANNYYEIDLTYPSSFVINEENNISISIDGDVRETFSLEQEYSFKPRGDLFDTIPLLDKSVPDPNNPDENDIGMRLDVPYSRTLERFKFVSSKFLVTIFGQTKDGLIRFNRLKLFGKLER